MEWDNTAYLELHSCQMTRTNTVIPLTLETGLVQIEKKRYNLSC